MSPPPVIRSQLTETERRVLAYLVAHHEQVVSKTQILTAVWGYEGFADNLVEVNVSALRRKLEAKGRAAGACTRSVAAATGCRPAREAHR